MSSVKSLGFVTLSLDEYKTLLENQKNHVLTKTDVYNGAKEFELTVLPIDEYRALLKKKNYRDSIAYEDLSDYASRLNLKLVPVNTDPVGSPTPIRRAASTGQQLIFHNENSSILTVSSTSTNESEYFDALQSVDGFSVSNRSSVSIITGSTRYPDTLDSNADDVDSNLDDVASHASTIRDEPVLNETTLQELQKRAAEIGYVLVASTSDSHPIDSQIGEETNENDQSDHTALPELDNFGDSDAESHTSSWDETVIAERARKIGMTLVTNNQYKDYERLKNEPFTREKLEACAEEFCMVVVEKDVFEQLKHTVDQPIRQQDVEKYLAERDMDAIEISRLKELEGNLHYLKSGAFFTKEAILKEASFKI